jgi:hypothetical protein
MLVLTNKKWLLLLCQLELSVHSYSNVMSSRPVIKSYSEIKICDHLFVKSTRSTYNASKVQKWFLVTIYWKMEKVILPSIAPATENLDGFNYWSTLTRNGKILHFHLYFLPLNGNVPYFHLHFILPWATTLPSLKRVAVNSLHFYTTS